MTQPNSNSTTMQRILKASRKYRPIATPAMAPASGFSAGPQTQASGSAAGVIPSPKVSAPRSLTAEMTLGTPAGRQVAVCPACRHHIVAVVSEVHRSTKRIYRTVKAICEACDRAWSYLLEGVSREIARPMFAKRLVSAIVRLFDWTMVFQLGKTNV